MRQKNDPDFANMIQRIRDRRVTEEDYTILNTRLCQNHDSTTFNDAQIIIAQNNLRTILYKNKCLEHVSIYDKNLYYNRCVQTFNKSKFNSFQITLIHAHLQSISESDASFLPFDLPLIVGVEYILTHTINSQLH